MGIGFVKHNKAGYAYFIYDTDEFPDLDAAQAVVHRWLSRKYGSHPWTYTPFSVAGTSVLAKEMLICAEVNAYEDETTRP